MGAFLSYALLALVLALAIPATVLVIEVVAALVLAGYKPEIEYNRPRLAALVPAHNETTHLLPTLEDIKSQLRPGDRLVVVADNCTDDTGAVAAAAGAEVATRQDPERIGKGYALDFGIRHLCADPPEVVVVVDADCRVKGNAIERLANACEYLGRPVQAVDLMTAPAGMEYRYRIAEFAWLVRNWVRPLGLNSLSLPCQLMGTGMAFPWSVISRASLANGHLVEDLKLGLDLAAAGMPAAFCPTAVVTSEFAASQKGAQSQRKRWEQGAISIMLHTAVPLIFSAIARRNAALLALALDAAVPPLALFALLIAGTFAVAAFAALLGLSAAPLVVASYVLLAFGLSGFLCWWNWGRKLLPASALPSMLAYLGSKLPLYAGMLTGKGATRWVRTERTSEIKRKEHETRH